jgi:formylglycine-generating enzyme required for sulfatase activity
MHIDRRPSIFSVLLVAVLLAVFGGAERASAQYCDSDTNGDGRVDSLDLTNVLADWGCTDANAINAVSPTQGSLLGGTLMYISGQGLAGAQSVRVGGVLCTDLTVLSPNLISARTPGGGVGQQAVIVTLSSGVPLLAPQPFTYVSVTVPAWATLIEAQPDPSVVTDANLRAAITATGLAWRVRDTATQIEFLLIPPGTFNMGCSASQSYGCEIDENPVHQVTLTNAFYLGRYEVTQAQWQARMGSNPSYFQSASTQVPLAQVPQRPVEQVSWDTIQGFLKEGMRLPTEAEWEYAYRAGTTTAFHGYTGQLSGTNDDNLLGNIAWYYQGSCSNGAQCQTRPVGGKAGNGFGLHDMSGNVWEWVNDWYGGYSADAQTNPQGPSSGLYRVLRGGSWFNVSSNCRASSRNGSYPDGSNYFFIGFRVARTP